jgi:hypothetical protein
MAFISLNSRVVEHRTRLVCLGETPSPRVRCLLATFTYLLTYNRRRDETRLDETRDKQKSARRYRMGRDQAKG